MVARFASLMVAAKRGVGGKKKGTEKREKEKEEYEGAEGVGGEEKRGKKCSSSYRYCSVLI